MPQPIDMQTELGRSMMAERIQDAVTRGALAALQRDQVEEKKAQALRETQVAETPETQSGPVDEDGRGKNPFVKRRTRRKDREGPSGRSTRSARKKRAASDDDDHQLDVSI